MHHKKEPDLKEKSEIFEMFQKMAPNEQAHIVDKLGIRHLNEIHGLEKMNDYPPDSGATAIVPGELVDLSNSNNIVDKEFAKRNLETTVNSKDFQHMGINEVHGPAMVGDFVAIKGNIFSFLHAGVVESVLKDGTITVIEKLGVWSSKEVSLQSANRRHTLYGALPLVWRRFYRSKTNAAFKKSRTKS